MKSNIPESALLACKNQKLIPLVGAGVSMALRNHLEERIFPSWSELLKKAADALRKEKKDDDADAIEVMLAKKNYKYAADFAREGLTGSLWSKFFKQIFQIEKETVSESSLQLATAVWEISNRIITLNYDKVLSFACPTSDSVVSIDNSSSSELADFIRNEITGNCIWHLHGRVDNVSSIVFTSESYNKLYAEQNGGYKAGLEAFRTLCRDESFLFIGCSLDDADILQQLSLEFDLFSGNIGPHYALIHKNSISAIQEKLDGLPIDLIPFEDFGAPLIEKIKEIKFQSQYQSTKIIESSSFRNPKSKHVKIAFLYAKPIGSNYENDDLLKEVKKLKCEVHYYPLTIRSLNELNDYDYIIISSQIIKGKFVIEDESLSSARLSPREIEDNIGCDNICGLLVFTDLENTELKENYNIFDINIPAIFFPKIEKLQISSAFFKIFKKKSLKQTGESIVVNSDNFLIKDLNSAHVSVRQKTFLSDSIDSRATKNYIGRGTDLENLCKKIVELRHENEILTIKGSGGIGKTLTIKKIAHELSLRNYFCDGIFFVDCEFINSYKNLEYNLACFFDAQTVPDFRKYIIENIEKQDKLIILDNVETLLYIDDVIQVREFIGFLCEFCTIVVTSRELLNAPYEQAYELRQFTTDEAYDLFISELSGQEISDDDKRLIRQDIIENLLDNNPLAIKLVTKNIPKGKSFATLRKELEDDLFRKISDTEMEELDNFSDINIEKRKSLYASINFSYQNLTEKEKIAFEIMSLFPDGISLENLKRISSERRNDLNHSGKSRPPFPKEPLITDPVIKSLDNKSMVQINNKKIKLQSIIGKFSDRKFRQRPPEDLDRFYKNAFEYNRAFADFLREKEYCDTYISAKTFNSHQMNFLKSISYIKEGFTDEKILDYIDDLDMLARSISVSRNFISSIKINSYLNSLTGMSEKCLKSIIFFSEYFDGEFDKSIRKMREIAPIAYIDSLENESIINDIFINSAIHIYNLEGDCLNAAKNYMKRNVLTTRYPSSLFFLGELNYNLAETSLSDFTKMETLYCLGNLTPSIIDSHIEKLFEKDHLERLQCHYVKSKITTVSRFTIKKLVVTNPYAEGLKNLMQAFVESDIEKKDCFFRNSLKNLSHIKYYYAEALLFYAKFLYEKKLPEFESIYDEGIKISEEHNFRFINFEMKSIKDQSYNKYDCSLYPIDEVDFGLYIEKLIKNNIRSRSR